MDAIKTVLATFLDFVKEVWIAIEFEEGVKAIEDILAQFAA